MSGAPFRQSVCSWHLWRLEPPLAVLSGSPDKTGLAKGLKARDCLDILPASAQDVRVNHPRLNVLVPAIPLMVVPRAGVEPTCPFGQRILSPLDEAIT